MGRPPNGHPIGPSCWAGRKPTFSALSLLVSSIHRIRKYKPWAISPEKLPIPLYVTMTLDIVHFPYTVRSMSSTQVYSWIVTFVPRRSYTRIRKHYLRWKWYTSMAITNAGFGPTATHKRRVIFHLFWVPPRIHVSNCTQRCELWGLFP